MNGVERSDALRDIDSIAVLAEAALALWAEWRRQKRETGTALSAVREAAEACDRSLVALGAEAQHEAEAEEGDPA